METIKLKKLKKLKGFSFKRQVEIIKKLEHLSKKNIQRKLDNTKLHPNISIMELYNFFKQIDKKLGEFNE